jgi:hypothetical protein
MDASSTSIGPQLVIAIAITITIFIIFMAFEQLYKSYLNYGSAQVSVYPYTGSSSKQKIIKQNPSDPKAITLYPSENQLTGIEFSYSMFLYISDENETATTGWNTIMYKGYESGPFPLCGPGLFVSTDSSSDVGPGGKGTPTLRIVMNSYAKWFNTLDIKDVPYNKWVHLALVLRKNTLEAYINGNIANTLEFNGTLPYQNYQSLILFPSYRSPSVAEFNASNGPKRGIPEGENFIIHGKFSGYVSSVTYYTYAISYAEIQSALTAGPSNKMDTGSMDMPPYLIDSWWTNRSS